MKPKTLLVLSVVVLILGAFIYFVERDAPSTDERHELANRALDLDAEDVESFTLHRRDGQSLHFVRQRSEVRQKKEGDEDSSADEPSEAAWRLTEPVDAPADTAEVTGVLQRLVELEKERDLEGVDREDAGLDEPRFEVSFDTAAGTTRLGVGVDVPLDGGAIVESSSGDGDPKVMQAQVTPELLGDLGRGVDAWRDRDLFPALRADVERVTFSDGSGSAGAGVVVLARRGDGENFFVESPIEDRADADRVRVLLAALTGLEAQSFLDAAEPLADPVAEAIATVEVKVAGRDEPFRIELGETIEAASEVAEEDARLRARVDGREVAITAGSWLEMASREAAGWRSRAWSALQVFQVDEATFGVPERPPVTLRRDGSDWLRTLGDGEPESVPYGAASDALYPATEIRAADLQRRAEVSDETLAPPPRLEIRFVTDDDEETLRLWNSLDAAGLSAATVDDREGVVLLLPSGEVDELLRKIETLREVDPVPDEEEASEEEAPAQEPSAEAGDAA